MKNPVSRSTLFLTELILDLFLFLVCTAVCVGLLIRAKDISRQSSELTRAVYLAQTAAESFRSGEQPQPITEDGFTVYTVVSDQTDGVYTAEITVFTEDGRAVYTLASSYAWEVTAS